MAFGKIGGLVSKVEGLLGKADAIFTAVGQLGKDVADFRAFVADGMKLWTDIRAGQAEIKGILTPGPTSAGSVIVPAPPAGHVLVAVPAEHAAALPDALAAIVGNVGAGIQGAVPK